MSRTVRVLWWLRFGVRMAWMLLVMPLVLVLLMVNGALEALDNWYMAVREEWRES